MPPLRDLSLRYKIPLRGTFLVLVTATLVTGSLIVREYDELKQDLEAHAKSLGRVLANTLVGPIIHDDVWRVFEIVGAGLAAGWGAGNPWSQAGGEMARNGGFEEGGSPIPQGWMRDLAYTGKKGTVSLDRSRSHSGRASLKLQPNSQNSGDFPLAIAQVIPAAAYRGKTVEYSGFVQAEGGATAELGMLSFVRGRGASLITVDQPS